jgi:putative ABC transport system permease protein
MYSLDHARLRQSKAGWVVDIGIVIQLALADYLHERRMTLPMIISLAAVLTPLLVLFGLKFGIISGMSRELTEDPRSRELRPLGQQAFDAAWFEALEQRPDVGFVIPKTRFLSATLTLRNPASRTASPAHVELTPSAPRDPLLEGTAPAPDGVEGVILSAPAADTLGVAPGGELDGRIGRILPSGEREQLRMRLRVDAVLPPARSGRLEALVSLPFLLAAEDFREGFEAPMLEAEGQVRPQGERTYAGFRLYARTVSDVADLHRWLNEQGVATDTRIAEIELIERLDRNLTILYLIVAGLGGAGYLISLTVSLWANTERKRRDLSVLRLMGLRSTSLTLLPATQSVLTAAIGSALAVALYLLAELMINEIFRDSLTSFQRLSRLEPRHLAIAALVTLLFAFVASVAAGIRAAGVSPSEGLRDE